MTIPPELGSSWERFMEAWCSGQMVGTSRSEIERSLSTLKRMFPEEIKRRVDDRTRGPAVVAPMVELGRLLGACEQVDGFARVLHRLRDGEWSAYPELVLTATLRGLGFQDLRLSPVLVESVPDVECMVEDVPVYFEVVAPEVSDAMADQLQMMDRLTREIEHAAGYRIEVDVLRPLGGEDVDRIVARLSAIPANTWVEIASSARARRVTAAPKMPPLYDDPHGIQVRSCAWA